MKKMILFGLFACMPLQAAVVTGDVYHSAEGGTPDTALTTTILNSGTMGTGGSWSLVGGTTQATGVGSKQVVTMDVPLFAQVTVGNNTYNDSGHTKALRFDMRTDSSYARYTFSQPQDRVSISFYWRPGWDEDDTSDRVHFNTETGGYFVLQTDVAGNAHAHGNGQVDEGPEIPLRDRYPAGTWYLVQMQFVRNGQSSLQIYLASNNQLIGTSAVDIPNSPTTHVRFGATDGRGSSVNYSDYYDDIIIDIGSSEPIGLGGAGDPGDPGDPAPAPADDGRIYVSPSGNDNNDGSPANPYATIGRAVANAQAGDVIHVLPGTYNETVSPTRNGTASEPITLYSSNRTARVVRNGSVAFNLDNRSYWRIIGFDIDSGGAQDTIAIRNSSNIEIRGNRIAGHVRDGISQDSGGGTSTGHNCIIADNYFQGDWSLPDQSRNIRVRGDNNIIEYNVFADVFEDCIYVVGRGNIVRNNYGFNINTNTAAHTDFIQNANGAALVDTLVEANLYIDSQVPADDHHFSNLQSQGGFMRNYLQRFNVAHDIGTQIHGIGAAADGPATNVFLYHETYVNAQRYNASSSTSMNLNDSANSHFYNSIAYEIWGRNVTSPTVISYGPGSANNYNLGFDPDGNVSFGSVFRNPPNNILNQNPMFRNAASDDFTLQSSSPAINAGGALTRTANSGTGTTFTVQEAGLFRGDNPAIHQYGGNLVVGDTITVGTDVVEIVSISGNSITVASSFTWASGEPVYFGTDTTPDMGAYPNLAAGFDYAVNISSHTEGQTVSGTQNIVAQVSNPEVVRYVIFYVNGLPMAVDQRSPFQYTWSPATTGRARVEAKAYSRFASPTLFKTVAVNLNVGTGGGPNPPTPPGNLRIVTP